ncbi:MAG: hypothetical protein ACXVY8_00095 [Gaiellaceae bacterium]
MRGRLATISRIIETSTCEVEFRHTTLAWRARLQIRHGELESYWIFYSVKGDSASSVRARSHNNESVVYWDGSFGTPDNGSYGDWTHRVIPRGLTIDGRDDPGDWIYIDGWFDLPAHDKICALAVSLKSGKSEPLYNINGLP